MRNDETDRFDLQPFLVGLAAGIVILGLFMAHLKGEGWSMVTCPEEDSCRAEYVGEADAWRIIPLDEIP